MISAIDHTKFEGQYISLREKEGRVYSNEEVKLLPSVDDRHPLKREWDIRKQSCQRLIKYLARKNKELKILEVGCGNGWLCNQLSKNLKARVTGIDINTIELAQARQNFPSVAFNYGDIREDIVTQRVDIIVFAASFQYFRSAAEILHCCFQHLEDDGEIHILDTNFYSQDEAANAAKRSHEYFAANGFPQMSGYYFHHTWQNLNGFDYELLHNPKKFLNNYFNKHPFPWICIKK